MLITDRSNCPKWISIRVFLISFLKENYAKGYSKSISLKSINFSTWIELMKSIGQKKDDKKTTTKVKIRSIKKNPERITQPVLFFELFDSHQAVNYLKKHRQKCSSSKSHPPERNVVQPFE